MGDRALGNFIVVIISQYMYVYRIIIMLYTLSLLRLYINNISIKLEK